MVPAKPTEEKAIKGLTYTTNLAQTNPCQQFTFTWDNETHFQQDQNAACILYGATRVKGTTPHNTTIYYHSGWHQICWKPPINHHSKLCSWAQLIANSITHPNVYEQWFHLANATLEQTKWHWHNSFDSQDICHAIIDEATETPLEYRQLIKWEKYQDVWVISFANELGHLGQGIRDVKGTNTIYFILWSAVHTDAQ